MSKILTIHDMLEACRNSNDPALERMADEVEAVGERMADALAQHFGIVTSDAHFSLECGFCASFSASEPGQECPDAIEMGDPSGDWEYREPLSCAPRA